MQSDWFSDATGNAMSNDITMRKYISVYREIEIISFTREIKINIFIIKYKYMSQN